METINAWEWDEINSNADWSARAGLQVVELHKKFFLFGGRTPIPSPVPGASIIHGDVWQSNNFGEKWKQILTTENNNMWPARAYFQALTKNDYMYIIGGQNFNIIANPGCKFIPPGVPCEPAQVPSSDFFNDVWRSKDGVNWTQMTADAGWPKRAGLSAVVHKNEIYVMGGSVNDDSSITPQGPARIYYNDVWKSKDGKNWELLTQHAPWAKRAGGVAVSKDGYIYMIGGEDGFICNPQTVRCPPYYNDVWRSKNGKDWEPVTTTAEWPSRPGHQVLVVKDQFVLFGGFGLDTNYFPGIPYTPSNPMDIWVSKQGKKWDQLEQTPWNSSSPAEIKYDFDALVVKENSNENAEIYTFGGDRETFDFLDFTNYLNVDNDVWKFAFPRKKPHKNHHASIVNTLKNYPNPFKKSTIITFNLEKQSEVVINIYNQQAQLVKNIASGSFKKGSHQFYWNGLNNKNHKVKKGFYIAKIWTANEVKTIKLLRQ